MLFNDEFIESLRDDPVTGTLTLCEKTIASLNRDHHSGGWDNADFDILVEAYSLLVEVIEAKLLPIAFEYPRIGGSISDDCNSINSCLYRVQKILTAEASKLRVESLRSKFRATLGSGFAYEFSQGDLDRVQLLLNQLRDLIANTHQLDKEHQQRLLKRLEKVQSEMHKKVSDLDRFWGLIGDAGVVLGKIGKDAKPVVDRIREIADIVWQTQSRAEELPSGTSLPSLENKPSGENEQA